MPTARKQIKKKLEIVFMKHCAPIHVLVHNDNLTR